MWRLAPILSILLLGCSSPSAPPLNESIKPTEASSSEPKLDDEALQIDEQTQLLGRNRVAPRFEQEANRIFRKILVANALSPTTAILAVPGCDSVSASSNVEARVIRICRGFFRVIDSDDALAFAISHELSHILLRHRSTVRTAENTGLRVTKDSVGAAIALAGLAVPGASVVYAASAALFASTVTADAIEDRLYDFNRQDEIEADRKGLDLMVTAGYSPKAATQLVNKVGGSNELPIVAARGFAGTATEEEKASLQYWDQLLKKRDLSNEDRRTHPSAVARIQQLDEQISNKYRAEAGREPGPFRLKNDRIRYLTAIAAVRDNLTLPASLSGDRNFSRLIAWNAMRLKKPLVALKYLGELPEEDAGPNRWLIMAAIAGSVLNDRDRAREYADKHFASGEWKRIPGKPPSMTLALLYASKEVQEKTAEVNCRNEYRYKFSALDNFWPHGCSKADDYKQYLKGDEGRSFWERAAYQQ